MSRNHRYSGQAKGPEWERRRSKAIFQHGRRCSRCGRAGRLEVHHRKPISVGGTNDLENLEVLCRGCHIDHHRPQPGERERAWEVLVGEVRDRM